MINFESQFSSILNRFREIQNSLNNMENTSSDDLVKFNREYADLKPVVDKIEEYKKEQNEIKNLNELIKDSDVEISKIAEKELQEKKNIILKLENELLRLLIPKDINELYCEPFYFLRKRRMHPTSPKTLELLVR